MTADVIAINIALLPDQAMTDRARAMNARIRQHSPQSFALDEEHLVHITLLQTFVRRANLEAIWQGVRGIETGELRAEGFDFYASGKVGACGFDVNLPPWLRRAHRQAVAAVSPFALVDGDARAFVTSPEEPEITGKSVNYVKNFIKAYGGKRYHPHVTLGIGPVDFLKEVREEPFEPFDFSIHTLALCQLGKHGTCRKVLLTESH